jgi:hypothetical protein
MSPQETDKDDSDRSLDSNCTELRQDSSRDMMVNVSQDILPLQSTLAKGEKSQEISEGPKIKASKAKNAENLPEEKSQHHGLRVGCESTKSQFESFEQRTKLVKYDLWECTSSTCESHGFAPQLSHDTAQRGSPSFSRLGSRSDDTSHGTKTESSIWNGCRENVETPLVAFPVVEETHFEERRTNRDISSMTRSRSGLLQSFRCLAFLKIKDERSDRSDWAVTGSIAVCDEGIWNGIEAVEIPLGGDHEVQPQHQTKLRQSKTPSDSSFVGKKRTPQPDTEIPKEPLNDPGFEIIYDDFVAE